MSEPKSGEPGQEKTERAQVLLDAVRAAFAESPTLEQAISKTLRLVCEAMRWEYGAFWRFDGQANVLRCTQVWHVPSAGISQFEDFSRQITLPPSVGFPGNVWVRGQLTWVPDMTQASFSRSAIAAKVGLRGGFGFPVGSGSEAQGVMEFFSRETIAQDKVQLELYRGISSQLSELARSKRPEDT